MASAPLPQRNGNQDSPNQERTYREYVMPLHLARVRGPVPDDSEESDRPLPSLLPRGHCERQRQTR
jgi:hypothetical protein